MAVPAGYSFGRLIGFKDSGWYFIFRRLAKMGRDAEWSSYLIVFFTDGDFNSEGKEENYNRKVDQLSASEAKMLILEYTQSKTISYFKINIL